ncbi:MAG: hypothetical protein M0P47_06740, partial [Bacteroidales bacterium]|nr:hypothetical protein [Bacteroidales bacterium]
MKQTVFFRLKMSLCAILMFASISLWSQKPNQISLSGKILDITSGKALQGAHISLENTANITIS